MPSSWPIEEARRKETWVMKHRRVSWEKKPTKEERREMQEMMRRAQPSDVGGILRINVGSREAAERMKRTKFRHERTRLGKEHDLLSLEEAII